MLFYSVVAGVSSSFSTFCASFFAVVDFLGVGVFSPAFTFSSFSNISTRLTSFSNSLASTVISSAYWVKNVTSSTSEKLSAPCRITTVPRLSLYSLPLRLSVMTSLVAVTSVNRPDLVSVSTAVVTGRS